jgi:hypothetical protein
MATESDRNEVRSLYRHLKSRFPSPRRVSLRFGRRLAPGGVDALGYWSVGDAGRETIVLDRDSGYELLVSTLIHEFAHHLSGSFEHGRKWSDAYSLIYREWEVYNAR